MYKFIYVFVDRNLLKKEKKMKKFQSDGDVHKL